MANKVQVFRNSLWLLGALLVTACASLPQRDPLDVTVAGIESLKGEGLEVRLLVKLRVQNPNDAAVSYNGAALKLSVQNRTLATGVSNAVGEVPRFGEAVVAIPVTISTFRVIRQLLGLANGQLPEKILYQVSGKLSGSGFRALRFQSSGEFALPTDVAGSGDAARI
jgi:LEA14-like dessication related protein